jgi:hypothetical protein
MGTATWPLLDRLGRGCDRCGGLADLHRIVAEIGANRRIAHTARTITSEDKGIDPSGQRTELAHRREVSDVRGVDYQPQIFGREGRRFQNGIPTWLLSVVVTGYRFTIRARPSARFGGGPP